MFSVRAPLSNRSIVAPVLAAAPAPVPAPRPMHGKLILIVDDEIAIVDGMRALLSAWGCVVAADSSGDKALAALGELARYPDLIIADYRLQGNETGFDVIRRVREELGMPLPAILITGTTAAELSDAVWEPDCDLLYKPVLPNALQAMMTRKLRLA
jgi:CheY-like chemotaxis protein